MIKIKGYKILNNIYLLYVVFFITIINLFALMYNKNYKSIILFSVLTLILYLFNKNMIIILLVSLIIVNSLNLLYPKMEGYENEDEPPTKNKKVTINKKNNTEEPENDIVKGLSNMALDTLLNNTEDMTNNDINTNSQLLQDTETDTKKLTKKIDKIQPTNANNDLLYDKIHEINNQMNELTALIQ